jgi:hypothetical protein
MTYNLNIASSLSRILWSTNGLKQHINELNYVLYDKNIDIALITETHLSPNTKLNLYGFKVFQS